MWRFANSLRALWLGLACLWALPSQAQRAIWMWEADSYATLEQAQTSETHLQFLQAKGIRTLYLYADAYEGRDLLVQQPQRYARLIERMHARGFEVYALLGSWYLHTERYMLPEYRDTALAMLQRVLDYNAQAAPAARFDGINLDIEPHLLDEWSTQRTELLTRFVDLSHAFMALKRRSGLGLRIGAAIPFWFDGLPVHWGGQSKPASEHLQDIYDYVTLMDYRDHAEGPDSILSHAREELAYARRIGKTVQIGIETSPNDIRKVSFDHLREADMERELGTVQQALSGDPAFGGFVIHHFSSYRRWLARQR